MLILNVDTLLIVSKMSPTPITSARLLIRIFTAPADSC